MSVVSVKTKRALALSLLCFVSRGAVACGVDVFRYSYPIEYANLRFEQSYREDEGYRSFRTMIPNFQARVLRIFMENPSFEWAFPNGIVIGTPYRDLFESLQSHNSLIASSLSALADKAMKERDVANTRARRSSRGGGRGELRAAGDELYSFAGLVGSVVGELRGREYNEFVSRFGYKLFEGKVTTGPASAWSAGFYREAMHLYGTWGNLRVAMCVPGLRISDVWLSDRTKVERTGIPLGVYDRWSEEQRNRNIDLVFTGPGGKLVWGEVKAHLFPLRSGSLQMEEAIKAIQKLIDIQRDAGLKLKVEMFFVNGVEKTAKSELEREFGWYPPGFAVRGEVFPDGH